MKTIRFRRITVERMPGVRNLVLDELCTGVNVILGPNAAGKSTLARAAGYLLWPRTALKGISIAAQIIRESDELSLLVESNTCKCSRLGMEIPYPDTGCQDSWAYFLGLPDLLQSEDKQIAQEVVRQIMGGLDISAACNNLGFIEDAVKPQGLKKEVLDADSTVDKARTVQRKLEEDERSLVQLRTDLAQSRASASLLPVVECALDLHRAQFKVEEASIQLSQYDPRAGLLRGDELQRLESLQLSETSANSQFVEAKNRIAESEQKLSQLSVPQDLPIDEIEDHLERLRQAEDALKQAESRLASSSTRKDAVSAAFEDSPESTSIDPKNLHDILGIARICSKLRQQVQSANALNEWIGPMEAVNSLSTVRNGVVCLQRWLRTPPVSSASINPYVAATLGAIIGIGAGLAIFINPLFALLCLVGLVALIVMSKRAPQQSTQVVFQTEYERLGLEKPQTWTADAVEILSEKLVQQQAHLEQEQAKQERWADSRQKLESLERDFAESENQLEAALKAVGFKLTGDETDITLLADALLRHRTLTLEIIGMESDLHQALENTISELNTLNMLLGESCSSYTAARRAAERCKAAVTEYNAEMERLNTAQRDAKQAEEAVEKAHRDIENLYSSLELESTDYRTLENLLTIKDRWTAASNACTEANFGKSTHEIRLRNLIKKLDDFAVQLAISNIPNECSSIESYFVQAVPVELESIQTVLNKSSAGIEPIISKITGIEKSIEIVKKNHDLELLTIQRNAKRDMLRSKRSEAMESSTGWLLAEYIRRTSTEHTQTLLSDAKRRFTEFTAGEFSLELDDQGQRLAAKRSVDGEDLSLDQLSSGTRAQLIIAARMAYLESQETEYALPLMLDESLATSDDDRAIRIAQSISQIAKQGRQILYFTAQSDEVQKWQNAAAECGSEFICLKLGN